MVVYPARLLCDYGSGARVLFYCGLGLGGAARRARPPSPELQGGRSFIMSLHSDGSPWVALVQSWIASGGHSQIESDSQMALF